MPKAILITPTELPRLTDVPAELKAMQAIIGGYIEAIKLEFDAVAYVDEEAGIKRDPPPINAIATQVARAAGVNMQGGIRGPMLIFGTRNAGGVLDGDEHDVPQCWINSLVQEEQA